MREILEALARGTEEGNEQACQLATDMLKPSQEIRKPFENVWALSRAMYAGYQTVRLNKLGQLERIPSPTERDLFYSNQILPRVRALVAGLTAARIRPQVVVADEDDPRARGAAKLGDEIVEGLTTYVKLPAVMRSAVMDAVLFGKGFPIAGWDKNRGPQVTVNKCSTCGAAQLNDQAACECQAEVTSTVVESGDFFSTSVSPFQFLPDPACTTLRDAQWCNVEWHMSKTQAESLFGGEFTETSVEVGVGILPYGERISGQRRVVQLWETFHRKTREHKKGWRLLWHGSRVLAFKAECAPDGELPVSELCVDEVPDRFWAKGIVEDLVPLQVLFNKTMQRLDEMGDLAADPRYLAEEGTMDIGEENAPRGGKVRSYKKNTNRLPQLEQPPQVSPVFADLLRLTMQQMDFIAQQYAPFRGEPSSSVTSGYQTRVLMEQAATSLSAITASIGECWARAGKMLLTSAQKHMTEQRVYSFAGDHGRPKVTAFRGADLVGYQDVIVPVGSASPESREARREFMLAMAKAVGEMGPDAQRSVIEAIDVGVKMPPDPTRTSRDQAQAENERMLAGETIAVTQLQFHEIHMAEHYMTGATEKWSEADERTQAILLDHIREHELAIVLEQVRKQKVQATAKQLAAMATGENPEPDEPEGPSDPAAPDMGAMTPMPAESPEPEYGGIQ